MDRCLRCLLFNDKISVRLQVLLSFGVTILFTAGVTLSICYGLLFQTGVTSYDTAASTIISNTKSSSYSSALDISASINQQLLLIAQSICMVGSLYSSVLLKESRSNTTPLSPRPSYREYDFVDGCVPPKCPADYSLLYNRSRVPYIDGYLKGSTEYSSVYLYSTRNGGRAVRTDSEWSQMTSIDPDITQVVDALSVQDLDLQSMYTAGPNTTMFFYVSAQLSFPSSPGYYSSVHRTFPGMNKGNDPSYDPPHRSWFQNAPENGVYLYGPYQETFTRQLVINLSSRKSVSLSSGKLVTLVTAAVMLLKDIEAIVYNTNYHNNGFGAVLKYDTQEVLVWKQGYSTFDYPNGRFKHISEVDPQLPTKRLYSSSGFEYKDANGDEWVVASVPFFDSGSQKSMIMLVFQQKDLVVTTLPLLQNSIDDTTTTVTTQTMIVIVISAGVLLVLVYLLNLYITSPLEKIRDLSEKIISIATVEEDKRDYSAIVKDTFLLSSRSDEIGGLRNEFFHVVSVLHNRTIDKREKPKYPLNPFHLPQVWKTEAQGSEGAAAKPVLTWESFKAYLSNVGIALPAHAMVEAAASSGGEDLDVLGSLSKSLEMKIVSKQAATQPSVSTYAVVPQSEQQELPANMCRVEVPGMAPTITIMNSLRTKFALILLLLLCALVAVMVITILWLQSQGETWMEETGTDMESQQMKNLELLTLSKTVFVEAFLAQVFLDVKLMIRFASGILNSELTNMPRIQSGSYLQSYAVDPLDPYSNYNTPSNYFSSYFYSSAASCLFANCYTNFYNLASTQQSSLLDLKMRSYLYQDSYVSAVQVGLESSGGMVRTIPYVRSSTAARPTTCPITDRTLPSCNSLYVNSACSNPGSGSYPAYNPKCRPWYQLGVARSSDNVYLQTPRISSAGKFIITAYQALRQNDSETGALLGVLNFNILMSKVSTIINAKPILRRGYCYLVETTNSSQIVVHPRASPTCSSVHCTEGFSDEEYAKFEAAVLTPIRTGSAITTDTYEKDGETWRVAVNSVSHETATYTLIATVPNNDILRASIEVQDSIDKQVVAMIIALAICLAVVTLAVAYISYRLVSGILDPINELKDLLTLVTNDDLNTSVPTVATSFDMRLLLDAFSSLMVALRFGSEWYGRGNRARALKAFEDALQLYTVSGNVRGIASAHNNIGATLLESQDYAQALLHFQESIKSGQQLLQEAPPNATADDITRLKRTISDRKGNLAILKLRQNNFSEAFQLLEELLESDKAEGYVMGCVVKQGILGHYYLQQGEIKSGERVFASALEFIRRRDSRLFNESWNEAELEVAEQVALYNLACLFEKEDIQLAVSVYLESLSKSATIHQATTTKTLSALCRCLEAQSPSIKQLAESAGFSLSTATGSQQQKVKRVAFVIDYSGSMSGSKIRTAIENLSSIMQNNIKPNDSTMIVHFNNRVFIDFDLAVKSGQEQALASVISNLNAPTGTTALYSAIDAALASLARSPSGSDWIVALTDGEDNSSTIKLEDLITKLKSPHNATGVIVIGVGSDLDVPTLTSIAQASPHGLLVLASGDKASMDEAFGTAMSAIENGQLILEE